MFKFWLKFHWSDNKSSLVLIMVWSQTGDKPLSEPMMAKFTDEYMHHLASMSLKYTVCLMNYAKVSIRIVLVFASVGKQRILPIIHTMLKVISCDWLRVSYGIYCKFTITISQGHTLIELSTSSLITPPPPPPTPTPWGFKVSHIFVKFNKLCWGQYTPCSDHYLPYPEIFNKDSYFVVIVGATQVENLQLNLSEIFT